MGASARCVDSDECANADADPGAGEGTGEDADAGAGEGRFVSDKAWLVGWRALGREAGRMAAPGGIDAIAGIKGKACA